ncbi:MAG: hypothetical protein GXP38_11885 [Chloroflexi bacterium]|nr:hypothetical protein [Chloroflexota bacterium]
MRLIELLAALQSIDTKLDGHRKRYAEIQAALKIPAELVQAQNVKQKAEEQVAYWRKERQVREIAVADQNRHIKAQEQKLYGGRIKDPREQVALQKNVESLKRYLETLEEAVLEAIIELEQAEADLDKAGNALSQMQASWAQQEAELMAEKEKLIADARKLKAKRAQVSKHIPAPTLKQYESLRKSKQGLAVVALHGNSCSGCGATLPTAIRQQLHGDDLVFCPICGRLLSEGRPR